MSIFSSLFTQIQYVKPYIFLDEKSRASRRLIDKFNYDQLSEPYKKLYNIIGNKLFSTGYNDTMIKIEVTPTNSHELYNPLYDKIVIQQEEPGKSIQYKAFIINDEIRSVIKDIGIINVGTLLLILGYLQDNLKYITKIFLVPNASGGKKAVVKYTVKQLQAIASKNNIKITNKVDGKTVRLNKQGLMTRLKRYKVI